MIIKENLENNLIMLSVDNMDEKILYSEITGGRLWSVIIKTEDEEKFNYQEVDMNEDEIAFRQPFIEARLAEEARRAEAARIAEEARLLAEQKAEEEARLLAEQEADEEVKEKEIEEEVKEKEIEE